MPAKVDQPSSKLSVARQGWFDIRSIVLVAGFGSGTTQLNAFDQSLRSAGIADFNLIRVTSIAPAGTPVRRLPTGVREVLGNGLFLPTVYDTLSSNAEGDEIAAAAGIAIPDEPDVAGVIFVCTCRGPKEAAEEMVRRMVAEGMTGKGHPAHRCEALAVADHVTLPWTSVTAGVAFCDAPLEGVFRL